MCGEPRRMCDAHLLLSSFEARKCSHLRMTIAGAETLRTVPHRSSRRFFLRVVPAKACVEVTRAIFLHVVPAKAGTQTP